MGAGMWVDVEGEAATGEVRSCEEGLLVCGCRLPDVGSDGLEAEANDLSVARELERLCARRLSVIWRRSEEVRVEMALPVALMLAVAEGGQTLLE